MNPIRQVLLGSSNSMNSIRQIVAAQLDNIPRSWHKIVRRIRALERRWSKIITDDLSDFDLHEFRVTEREFYISIRVENLDDIHVLNRIIGMPGRQRGNNWMEIIWELRTGVPNGHGLRLRGLAARWEQESQKLRTAFMDFQDQAEDKLGEVLATHNMTAEGILIWGGEPPRYILNVQMGVEEGPIALQVAVDIVQEKLNMPRARISVGMAFFTIEP